MAGKAHGGWLSVFLRLCFVWAGMNAGANAEGAEEIRGRTQKAQKLRRSRKREYQICLKKARTSVYAGCRA